MSSCCGLGPHGMIDIKTGWADQGAGLLTALQRILSTEFGIEHNRITLSRVTTAEAPEDPGAGGSRGTHIMGQAALVAAARLRSKRSKKRVGTASATPGKKPLTNSAKADRTNFTGTYTGVPTPITRPNGAIFRDTPSNCRSITAPARSYSTMSCLSPMWAR